MDAVRARAHPPSKDVPQGLKPLFVWPFLGMAEAMP